MGINTYVPSLNDVRALLGVSSDELEDAEIDLLVYERSLEEAILEVDSTLLAKFKTVIAKAAEARAEEESRLFKATQTYATYQLAHYIAGALPQFSPKTISDGKAMTQRHADSPYKITIEAINRGRGLALSRLRNAITVYDGGSVGDVVPFYGMAVSSPTSDPVTGT